MRTVGLVAVALAAAGCSHGPSSKVLEADYARLQPEQTVTVEVAQAELARAREELAAARSRFGDARREEALAAADRDAAAAERKRVERLLENAEARHRAADARREYAEKLLAAREADEEAAKRRVELAGAKIELVKLQALERGKVQPAAPYDQSGFYARVAEAQRRLDDARATFEKRDAEAREGQRRWEGLARKVPAAAE